MRIDILVFDGVADSGLGLFRDVFAAANLLAGRVDEHIGAFEVSLRATSRKVSTGYGLTTPAEPLAATLDSAPDHLLVPSLGLVSAEQLVATVAASPVVEALRALHDRGVAVAAACSGTFLLAEAGLLDGRAATTSWWLGPCFRERYPTVRLDESQALVISDAVTTAGAALAHLDLALSVVGRVSPRLSAAVSDYLAVGDRPQQGELVRPRLLATSDPVLLAFDEAVHTRIGEAIDIRQLAATLNISQRTLQRLTRTVLGMTPVHYVQQVRLERAIDLLRTTELSITAVARTVGYRDATTLSTLIRRRRGTTPEQIRRRRTVGRSR